MTVLTITPRHSQNPGVEEEKNLLRYWLTTEDVYMSNYTRRWLERTPPEEAAATLAEIADEAQSVPNNPISVLLTLFATSGLATSDGIAGKGPGARRAATRAALMLAKQGDIRALSPLIRVFDPYGICQSRYQAEIEEALTDLLSDIPVGSLDQSHEADIQQLVQRTWNAGGGRRDLTASLTSLLLAALPLLREPNASLLKSIATARTSGVNRAQVREDAQGLLLQYGELSVSNQGQTA